MTMQETPTTPRLPHGYATDDDALRAIVSMYAERSLDALRDYHAASRREGFPHTQTLDVWSRYRAAYDLLARHWALGHAGAPLGHSPHINHRHEAWLRTVEADVDARLDGDMGRPLPEPGAP